MDFKEERIITNTSQASLNLDQDIQYTVRRSSRAKHMRINARKDKGIEVVLPQRMAFKHVEPFVQQHRHWIAEQVEKLGLNQPVVLPDTVELAAIQETWRIQYEFGTGKTWRSLGRGNNLLTIRGPDSDTTACIKTMNRWLRKQAQKFLPDLLYDISQRCQLPYKKVTLRTQRSRWGSCSSQGNINLNDRLMLLPFGYVEYVLIHELCHTRHLNHSSDFWSLVSRFSPDYRLLDKQLKHEQQNLPSWV